MNEADPRIQLPSTPLTPAGSAHRLQVSLEREARLAARKADLERRERDLERLTRAAELAKREQALSDRQKLIERIELHLERSRLRLEERIRQIEAARGETHRGGPFRRLQAVTDGYFAHGEYPHEDDWWAMQLGGKSERLAV